MASKRIGAVSLPPYGFPVRYFWSLDREVDGQIVGGYGENLRRAKRCLELAYQGKLNSALVRSTGR